MINYEEWESRAQEKNRDRREESRRKQGAEEVGDNLGAGGQ